MTGWVKTNELVQMYELMNEFMSQWLRSRNYTNQIQMVEIRWREDPKSKLWKHAGSSASFYKGR